MSSIRPSVARRAGVDKRIHPHTYRHSMATFLRNQGVPLGVVQLLLGHEDPRTTQLYAHLALGPARAEYDRAMAGLGAAAGAMARDPLAERGHKATVTAGFDRHHIGRN